MPHIAGQILVGGLPATVPVIAARFQIKCSRARVFEDDAFQVLHDLRYLFAAAHERRHIAEIHTSLFTDTYGKGFCGSIHALNAGFLLDGSLMEHICLALQIAVIVQHFQRAQKIVRRIIGECQPIGTVIDKSVFFRERIIQGVQFILLFRDGTLRSVLIHLQINQFIDAVTESNHAFDTFCSGGVQLRFDHAGVLPEVHFAVHYSIGVVFHIRVSGDGCVDAFTFTEIGQFRFLVGAANVFHGIVELIGKLQSLYGSNGEVLSAVLGTLGGLSAKDHFRVVDEIAVDRETVLIFTKVYPFRFYVDRTVALLQKDDVRDYFRTGVLFESVVGQTDRTQQFCPLCDILPHIRGLLIHCVPGGHKSDHAARSYLIEGFGEEIVMDGKARLVVCLIVHLILTERYVADSKIKKVTAVGGFKTGYGDICFGIKLLCDTSCDTVQFHTIQAAVSHFLREKSEEIADTHGRLQNVAAFEAHLSNSFIDCIDNGGACIVGIQRGCTGSFVFLRGQQRFQFRILGTPLFFAGIKSIGKTAPAYIA